MTQSLAKNLIHIVFSTKNRAPFLVDRKVRGEMHAYLQATCERMGCPSLRVGGVEDHVHLLCRLSKNRAGADFIREIKKSSSKWIKSKGGDLSGFYWQGGYAYFSVHPTQVDRLIDNIEHQEEHHKHITFQEEYRNILDRYGMEYDENYMWD